MKYKNIIRSCIIAATTLALLWAIPSLVSTATYSSQNHPFVYFSSVVKQFCFRKTIGKQTQRYDAAGQEYTESQFDSIMPMMYYRQLALNGLMPDSINGAAVTPQIIRSNSFIFRYRPSEMSQPHIGLYVLLESMSGRANLQSPGDAFRFKDKIEFIDILANTVDREKSELYEKELNKRGYTFPTQWAFGDFSTQKSFDEGYFALDASGQFFHMKQVSGKPFIRNTKVGDSISIAHFSMLNVSNKRFYGFVFDNQGYMYILESPSYKLRKLDLPPLSLHGDDVLIMGNMFYWTVTVTTEEGKKYFALNNETLQKVDEYLLDNKTNRWDKVSSWLFPAYITLSDNSSRFVQPKVHFTALTAFALNIAIALIFAIFARKKVNVAFHAVYILVTGVAGLIAVLITPDFK
ncbi:MAG: DUF4857 domain-containing protein [Prevotellaceae bacterium]|jgi:hypothetical protein|nr:DUF4857 domain-containing protein [Prevotellaceae bacterium]